MSDETNVTENVVPQDDLETQYMANASKIFRLRKEILSLSKEYMQLEAEFMQSKQVSDLQTKVSALQQELQGLYAKSIDLEHQSAGIAPSTNITQN